MKIRVILLLIIGGLSALGGKAWAADDFYKLQRLRDLVERGVIYDRQTPLDSVIRWRESLLPLLSAKENKEDYFLLYARLVEVYLVKGDISLAIDGSRQMYTEARDFQNMLGSILAKQALGDTYRVTGMSEKAVEFYQQALDELQQHDSLQAVCRLPLVLRMSVALQQAGQLEEAKGALDELKDSIALNPEHPWAFYVWSQEITYHIVCSERYGQKKYLDDARVGMTRIDSIYSQTKELNHLFALRYLEGAYYCALGKWDNNAYEKAIDIYNGMRIGMFTNKGSVYHRMLSAKIVQLYTLRGRYEEACQVYKDLYPVVDSIASQNYSRQINTLKTKYTVDQLAIETEEAHNRLLMWLLSGTLLLLLLFCSMAFWLKRLQHAIRLSTEKLEISRQHAENATRAKSVFLSNMSHEIRTPLNALSGFSGLLTEEGLDDATRVQCNEIIQQNSELLLKLIDDVIDLSSLEFGKMQFNMAPHDAIVICRNVIDTVGKVKQTQAELRFESDLTSCEVVTDDSRLQQVLINLLINATKFTPQGSITLRVEKLAEEDSLFFSVTDTGCGIPLEKQGSLFQRFEKLNENVQGSGLGLSICQLIIEHIGGKIWIDPAYTAGARFCFTHPIHQEGKEEIAQ